MSVTPKEDPVKITWYSSLAFKILLGYIFLWGIVIIFLSDFFLNYLGLDQNFIAHVHAFRHWIFLLITAPVLYWIVMRLSRRMNDKNHLLAVNEKKLVHLNRMHSIISEINHIILRAHDRKLLLREITSIIQKKGEYSFVWIGLGEIEATIPKMIVTSNENNHYLQDLFDGLQIASTEEKEEPALFCFQKKHHIAVNNVEAASKKRLAWQKRALENNYEAIAAFPLRASSGWSGVLAVYAAEKNVFTEEEVKLMSELASDVSYGIDYIEQKEKLYYVANYDLITNLPNQHLLEDRLNQSIARANHDKRTVGLACIELVDLEEFVNVYGEVAGDKVLRETSKHLSRLVREGDTIARLGNKELGIMLADVADPFDIPLIIQKVIRPFLVQLTHYKEVSIQMRAGVSIYPKDAENGLLMIKNAQLALRSISHHEKIDCAYFSKEIVYGVRYTKTIDAELSSAFEKKEFSLYYQPIIDPKIKKMVAAEALLRWHNPKLGDLNAIQFIQIAEEKPLIIEIDEWVIRSACLQLQEWKKKGSNFPLSVNISEKTFFDPTFIQRLKNIFNEIDFDPNEYHFGIEISENFFAKNTNTIIEILVAIKQLKLKTYIDDFGMGYVSLAYLDRLSIEALKIDPMLVRNSEKEKTTKTTIQGIVALAKGMGIKTIAEGVESEKQLEAMKILACDWMQGYLFTPPVSAKDITAFFDQSFNT